MYNCTKCEKPLDIKKRFIGSHIMQDDKQYILAFCKPCRMYQLIIDMDVELSYASNHFVFTVCLLEEEAEALSSIMSDTTNPNSEKRLRQFDESNKKRRIVIEDEYYDFWY